MIRSTLLLPTGEIIHQAGNVTAQWRNTPGAICWIDLVNEEAGDAQRLLESLGCHNLAILDSQRDRHPPKLEIFDDSVFIIYRGISSFNAHLELEQLQVALFVGANFLVTRHNGGSFAVAQWLSHPELAKYLAKPLLLATRILHTAFGRYLDAITDFEIVLAEIEEAMQGHANDDDLRNLVALRSRLRKLRRTFNYHERLSRSLLAYIKEHEHHYLLEHDAQDLHERSERVATLLDMYYEICGDLIEAYYSITSHQLNKTMQVLTVVTTVFVPLSFLAGLYGMNFDNMPELHHPWGYFYLLGAMGVMAAGALITFKLKRWL